MGRPLTRLGFGPEHHRVVVYWMARGFTAQQSAAKAGIARGPRFSDALKTETHASMLRDAIDDMLATELAPIAAKVLRAIVTDEKQPGRVRVDAAKTILDRSGHVAHDGHKRAGEAKELSEMTLDELRAFVRNSEDIRASKARDVSDEMVEVQAPPTAEAEDEPITAPVDLFT